MLLDQWEFQQFDRSWSNFVASSSAEFNHSEVNLRVSTLTWVRILLIFFIKSGMKFGTAEEEQGHLFNMQLIP